MPREMRDHRHLRNREMLLVGDRTYGLNHSELRNKGFQKKMGTRTFGVQDIMKMGRGKEEKKKAEEGKEE